MPGPRRYLLPSPTDLVFILFLVSVPLVRGWHVINTDGDLGRHLRVGETILADRALFYTDRFSHTMAGQPFVPYEWLSEVLFALAHRMGGLPGVVVFTGLLLAATYALLSLFLQRSGVDPLAGFVTAVAAGAVGAVHWLARPHLFTLLGAVLTLWLLERGGRRAPWLVAGLFVVWANLHGGFLYGLVLIGLYVAGDLAEARWGDGRTLWLGRAREHAVYLAAAVAGSLLNPAGPGLLAHVVGYLGKDYLVDRTAEYQSPDFHAFYGRLFLAVLVGVIGLLAAGGRRPIVPRLLTVLVNVAFALVSLRNIPLFGVTALPLVALHLARGRAEGAGGVLGRVRARFETVAGELVPGAWSAAAAAGMLLLPATPARALLRAEYDPRVFPVAAVERARAAGLTGRLFNEFEWGGYVLYAWPEQRVFIDGQTDLYGEALTREYAAIQSGSMDTEARLAALGVHLLLVRRSAPVALSLQRSGLWNTWHVDSTSILLLRDPASAH
jgi:hypothetical protein